MRALNLEGLDDPIEQDFVPDFSGGMVSFEPPSRLQLNQASLLVNIDINDKPANTRRGTRQLGVPVIISSGSDHITRIQGLAYFDAPSFEYLVAAAGGTLWASVGGNFSAFGAYVAADPSREIEMAQLVDKLYIADGASHLFEYDGAGTLTDLGTGGATQPPIGSIVITHTSRLWMAGVSSVPDGLYASQPLTPATWHTANLQIRVGGGEGDAIVGLAGWDNNQLVVGKRNSLWIVLADPATTATSLATATVTRVSGEIGVMSHRSMAQVGNDIWFLAQDGVRSLGRTLANNEREISDTISAPIVDLIERINWEQAHKAAACFWRNRYMLSVPLDSSTEPNVVLVYNTLRKAWSGYWTNWTPLCWAKSRLNNQTRLNFGRVDSAVWQWKDDVLAANEDDETFFDADGTPVEAQILTRALIFNDALATKSGCTVEFEFYRGTAEVSASLVVDSDDQTVSLCDPFEIGADPLTLDFVLPQVFPAQGARRVQRDLMAFEPFRELQFFLESTNGKQGLRSIVATAFLNAPEVDDAN
jgi:hypothetical protein